MAAKKAPAGKAGARRASSKTSTSSAAQKIKRVEGGDPARRHVQRVRKRLPTPEEIREGLATDTLGQLGRWLRVSDAEFNQVLRISRSTRRRREESGKLSHEESDRVANVLRAFAKAMDYFEGDEEAARRWMKHPAPAFDGETPLRRCDTAIGAQAVIRLLTRLEHGIPA